MIPGMGSRRMSRSFAVFASLALALISTGCVGGHGPLKGRASDEWTRTYTLQDGGEFQIVGAVGTIDVTGGDGPSIEVKAERVAHAPTDEAAKVIPSRIRILEDVTPNAIVLRNEGLDGVVIGIELEVNFHVTVPRATRLRLRTASGDITVSNMGGRVVASTTNGTIIGTGLAGGVEARTTNGNVTLDVAALANDPLELRTTNGAIALTLPAAANAVVDATCVNGTIAVEGFSLEASDQGKRRRVRGTINGGGTLVQLASTNGNITLKAAQ